MTVIQMAPLPCAAADLQIVKALHDLGEVLSMVQTEFTDRIDRAALLSAQQLIIDVAIKHDELGRYGVYPAFGAEEEL